MRSQSKRTGTLGEELADKFLRQKGYKIITRNYHIRGGEIDIIAKKDNILLFVEVKTRTNERFGLPEEALTHAKRRKLLRAIYHYLADHPHRQWRCDLITLRLQGGQGKITHYHNIFS